MIKTKTTMLVVISTLFTAQAVSASVQPDRKKIEYLIAHKRFEEAIPHLDGALQLRRDLLWNARDVEKHC